MSASQRLRLLAISLLALGSVTLPPPGASAAPPPPGPPIAALPASLSSSTAPGSNTGGAGSAALNGAVSTACNGGHALAGQQWYALPTGNLGKLYTRGQAQYQTLAHGPSFLSSMRTALVDYSTSTVLACGSTPATVGSAALGAVVLWFDAAELTSCRLQQMCGSADISLFIGTTSGTVSGNDAFSAAHVIGSLPYKESGDSSLATPASTDPNTFGTCVQDIVPTQRGSVWWKYTATATGDLPLGFTHQRLGPPASGYATDLRASLYEQTSSGLQPVPSAGVGGDDFCSLSAPYPVTAGHTYYVEAYLFTDEFLTSPGNSFGSPFTLDVGRIGALGAPNASASSGSSGSVTLSWTPNDRSAGTGAPTGWKVSRDGTNTSGTGPTTVSLSAATSSFTFTGLRVGSTYTFTVRGVNATGDGVPTTLVVRPFLSPPVASISGSLSTSARTATVTWTAPPATGSAITGYRVTRSGTDSGGNGAFTTLLAPSARSFTFSFLVPGETYSLFVQPINGAGPGAVAGTQVVLPGVPSEPTDISDFPDAAGHSVQLFWSPPSFVTSPVTGYLVSRDGTDSGSTGPFSTTVSAGTSSFTMSFLNGWEPYTFTVRALSAEGTGPAATLSETLSEPTPARPSAVVAKPGNGSVTVTWVAPTNTGTSAVTSYRVRRFDGTTHTVLASSTVGSGIRSFTATVLTNGHSYSFDVTASNSSGLGGTSVRSNAVTAGTPLAPTIGTASGGAAGGAITATARWSAPASNGTSAITGYVVTARKPSSGATATSATQPASARSLTMTLPSTGTWTFTVQAVNASGRSAPSAASNGVPAA